MIAVDDGLWSGNLNLADLWFLFALILAGLAAILSALSPPVSRFAATLGYAAVALVSFGLLVL